MKMRKVPLFAAGLMLSVLWAGNSSAGPMPTPIGYVQLEITKRDPKAGGGGISHATIIKYYNTDTDIQDTLGNVQKTLKMICLEYEEYSSKTSWYAIYEGLEGLPSGTKDITSDEADFIERVLTREFKDDGSFDPKDSTATATGREHSIMVNALQALIWEAGWGGGDDDKEDFNDGVDRTYNPKQYKPNQSGIDRAGKWLGEAAGAFAFDTVDTYALSPINVGQDWDSWDDAGEQDFMAYAFSPPQISSSQPAPAPATLLLIGIGLTGLSAVRRFRA